MKKFIILIITALLLTGCELIPNQTSATTQNVEDTKIATEQILTNQNTPTDIDWSLERFNLIKRAYWVNGQRAKADAVPCPVERPIGYIVLFSDNGSVIGRFTVDGKITSLNSYLSPDSDYYEINGGQSTIHRNHWLADVDGSYGTNIDGIFFFTVDGKYVEWTGNYLYSDIPFEIEDPVLKMEVK